MKYKIFDTHCHYNLEPLYSGKAEFFNESKTNEIAQLTWLDHWQQAQEAGVAASLVAGTDLASSKRAIKIAQQDKLLFASVGLNPVDFECDKKSGLVDAMDKISPLAEKKEVVAIGEAGLDYYRLDKSSQNSQLKKLQKEIFINHIHLANSVKKPLIIHARDSADEAYFEIIELLKNHYQFHKPFVLHCVSGPKEYIKQALKMGAYISFAGNITYPNAQDLQSLLPLIPKEKLMIETDAPFLPPQEKRGRVNQPKYILHTAKYLQKQHQVDLQQIYRNSLSFFDIQD
jgi:TatD DNase family protein